MKYLIDTDWIIDHLNGVETITIKLEKLASSGICTSIISVAELYEGVYGSKDYNASLEILETFLEGITVLSIDHEVCKIFGRERNKLRKQGNIIGDFDILIASICLKHNLILLTNNKKHFEKINALTIGLQ
ncbi:MAG: PIN domain nuclease [Nitrospirae bacterium CG_4_10_14_3_um_filter_44_29]|nr:type II toxin-antitoxin system VapC family toxin [Nitrospirota bacterium]PIP70457.1 MAG: PIN domain nuclease [Nitrospirae bacterium CG22_combo_CG10-13_8_21_14_all_44_11]PIV65572.1 MAG: PIN domain nuclease [Nitrospirae bacterium CG01_land_8_20_14_3_00_44_22]PIX87866.1 MAG: PIN domain nuclease [Nitrospirae bacterium CG_4_10_14_3_um_filter_44_29]